MYYTYFAFYFKDLLASKKDRMFLRTHFCAFIRYEYV